MSQQRKYFGTDGIRGKVGEFPINPEFMLKLGWAVGRVLTQTKNSKVLIGKDTRVSGYMFESALEAGLSAAGVDVQLLGPMPTPAIAYLTRTLRAQAGIVISASHNPYYDNGIKFFSELGFKLPDQVELAIEQEFEKPMQTVSSADIGKVARLVDAPGRYIEFCKSCIPSIIDFAGMKVVVDCANGAAYHIAGSVFRELGADVIELGVEPDGFNINQDCGSTRPEQLVQRVLAESADLGVALDGDADRVIMVDHQGNLLNGDQILYIIAMNSKRAGTLAGGVVGTHMTNMGLELAFQANEIPFKRVKIGDRYVIEELVKQGWLLGGESSGHIIWLPATTTGDGIVAALQVMMAMQMYDLSLQALTVGLTLLPQTLINVPCQNTRLVHTEIFKQAVVEAEHSLQGNGRILVRPSGTEPVLRIMVEGERDTEINQLAQALAERAKALQVSHA